MAMIIPITTATRKVLIRSMAHRYDAPDDRRAAGKRYAERLRSLREETLGVKPWQERASFG